MKKLVTSVLPILVLLFFSYSCQQEENLSPSVGKATFSLSPQTRSNSRVSETTAPAFVLLSIKDGNGNVQDNIKLPLYALGQSYLSENLDLRIGSYQLTQFAVLDPANKIIYATPLEESDLAKYVTDPLPMLFAIAEDQNVQIVPQVLTVSNEDTPESFGLASFGFEVVKAVVKLHSEEFFRYDPANSASTDGFVGSHKRTYTYAQDKLIQVDTYDYDPYTNSYDYPGYRFEEYHYDDKGKLARKIQFVGDNGIKWIHEYEYLTYESIKVTRHEYYKDAPISLPDWWIMEKGPSSLTVKYYQLNNELYAELNYEMDGKGNVISKTRNPSFSGGKIYYKHDNSPNPYKFPVLGGAYGLDTEKYLSQNNVIESTNDSNGKSTRIIEYNKQGYPVIIIAPAYKRVLTYQ